MNEKAAKRKIVWFVAGFLLAGVLHVFDRLVNAALFDVPASASALPAFCSTLLFVLNLAVLCALVLWWAQSVYDRLLPSVGRSCMLAAAALMMAFLMIRSVKYRLAGYGTLLEHICWYAYYVPLAAIPALFLTTALYMEPERRGRKWQVRLVLAVTLLLVLGVATNDLHYLMFRPRPEGLPQGGQWSTYYTGPLWYALYGFIILCIILGLVLLALADRRKHRGRRAFRLSLLLLVMLGMMTLSDRLLGTRGFPVPWAFPETSVFCMIGIFESCIRSRLIPFNEGYIDFFEQLQLPVDITDPALQTVYRTAKPVQADESQRKTALDTPLLLDGQTRLYGRRIDAGYAFWVGDESTLQRLNEALEDANEVLESENELLRLETEQAAERLRVDARNRVYALAAAEVYGTQKKIAALLDRLGPGAEDYSQVLAQILLLNAYVKRKTNFALQAAERETVTAQELYLALDETARFLELCGVQSSVEQRTDRTFTSAEATALYDSFALLAERFAGSASHLMALLTGDALRLMVECETAVDLPQTPAQIETSAEDGLLYLTLCVQKGGAV